ncbi:MAG: response regulator [Proteobacteria bacterium]|nr:response regulator [Pseudomonadota bacterium]
MMDFGAVASVALQLADRDQDPKARSGRAPGASPRALRVLIVEDELMVAWHLESMLEAMGHEVSAIAPSAEAAEADFRDLEPDLVFMDINLGRGPSGIEVARTLLAIRETPLVFVTAYGDPMTRAAIAQVAPNSPVVSKPVSGAELERGMHAALRPRH